MPQYLLSVHGPDGAALPTDVNPDEVFAAVGALNDELDVAGALVFAGGLHAASSATTVSRTGEVTEGPALPGPQALGGFWVVELPDADAALALAKRAAATGCADTVEVRAFEGE